MSLAIFDLDNTLLGGDSDVLWGQFLVEKGLVDGAHYSSENQRFYDEYNAGTLDIYEFLAFSLKPLSVHDMAQLKIWRNEYMQEKILPIVLPKAVALVEKHRQQNHTLMIITATNKFVTELIAEQFSIPHLLATEPEMIDGQYTGKVSGTPCFQDGKVTRLNEWLKKHDGNLDNSFFYSDSHNDIPLLEKVTHAIAVDADEKLQKVSGEKQWKQMSLRD